MSDAKTFSVGDTVTVRSPVNNGDRGRIIAEINDTAGTVWYEVELPDSVVLCRLNHLGLDAVGPLRVDADAELTHVWRAAALEITASDGG